MNSEVEAQILWKALNWVHIQPGPSYPNCAYANYRSITAQPIPAQLRPGQPIILISYKGQGKSGRWISSGTVSGKQFCSSFLKQSAQKLNSGTWLSKFELGRSHGRSRWNSTTTPSSGSQTVPSYPPWCTRHRESSSQRRGVRHRQSWR